MSEDIRESEELETNTSVELDDDQGDEVIEVSSNDDETTRTNVRDKSSGDEELENYRKTYEPDIMIVGSDWKDKSVIGSMYAAELRFFDRLENYATSKTIQSIIDRG